MSLSKKRKPEDDKYLSQGTKPTFPHEFDRYCTICCAVFENLAVEKFTGIKCGACGHEYDISQEPDGNFRKCVRCCGYVRCTEKFCTMCGKSNPYYDSHRPSSMERRADQQLRACIRRELEADLTVSITRNVESKLRVSIRREIELELGVDEKEVKDLSQSCVEDGNFFDSGSNDGKDLFTSTPIKGTAGTSSNDKEDESESENGEVVKQSNEQGDQSSSENGQDGTGSQDKD